MRTSIRQVAERASVSPMTVSNVLRERATQVSPETRERVLEAVAALNYIPVRAVMQNRHVTTNALGVLFWQDMRGAVGYPTFLGICDQAKAIDHDLTILLRSEPAWLKAQPEAQFLDRRCDGFIFVGNGPFPLSETLVRNGVPLVECYSVSPPEGAARIVCDNTEAMTLAVEHLAGLGHTRIAHVAGPSDSGEARERLQGFRAALRRSVPQSEEIVVQADSWGDHWGFEPGEHFGPASAALADAVLARDVTAVVCANDLFALAVWKRAEQTGLRVPDDVSIIGMDDHPAGALKGLTSIAIPFNAIGVAAVDAIHALIKGGCPKEASRVLPVSLTRRRSVAPPPQTGLRSTAPRPPQ